MAIVDGRMHWASPLFVHFPVRAQVIEPLLPPCVTLDLYRGRAMVSLVALEAGGAMPALGTSLGFGRGGRFHQVTLRTYVQSERGPGVVLLDTVVDRRLTALSARLLGMPYRVARPIALTVGDDIALTTPDLRLTGRVVDDWPAPVARGSLEHFLLERYWVYGRLPGGIAYGVRFAHPAWHIRTVEVAVALTAPQPILEAAEAPIAAHLGDEQNVGLIEMAALRAPEAAWDPFQAATFA